MLTVLEARHPSVTAIFAGADHITMEQRQEYLQEVDKLLNLLWRLCYAYLEMKAISIKELDAFGWYLWKISESPELTNYCNENGFEEINMAIKRLQEVWDA